MNNVENIAKALAELGHKTRLEIHLFLVKKGKKGAIVSDIQKFLNIPNSTLSHHIAALESVGLIKKERKGRNIYCTTDYSYFLSVLQFLQKECCNEEDGVC